MSTTYVLVWHKMRIATHEAWNVNGARAHFRKFVDESNELNRGDCEFHDINDDPDGDIKRYYL